MPATPAVLEARARIRRAVRDWFDGQGFVEVETPARVRSPGQEVHLDAIAAGDARWLITSPEYHLKKLVAAGLPRIYELCRCWRADESGPHHATEFTMLEWYRARAPLEALADDCEALVRLAIRAAGREPPPDVDAPFTRTTVRELFADFAGIELGGDEDAATLRAKAEAAGVAVGARHRLGRHLLPGVPGPHRTGPGGRGADVRVRLAGAAGRAGPPAPARPAAGRAVRALRQRARAGERLRRADRPRRAAAAVPGRSADPRRAGAAGATRWTRRCWRRCPACPRPPASRWASIAWSCSRSGTDRIDDVLAFAPP